MNGFSLKGKKLSVSLEKQFKETVGRKEVGEQAKTTAIVSCYSPIQPVGFVEYNRSRAARQTDALLKVDIDSKFLVELCCIGNGLFGWR